MIRYRHTTLALVLGLLLPSLAEAQSNKDNKWTKEADKFIGLAMTRQNPEERRAYYQQALDAVRPGLAEDPQNARVWYVAGQAHVGIGNYLAADSMFDKAVALVPELAEEIEPEREAGWMQAFQEGVDLMDQQDYEGALRVLEASQQLYDQRPEALLNIGSIYANMNDLDKAEEAFMKASEAARGPLLEKLDTASQEQWQRFAVMAQLNVAQMRGTRGVDAFTENNHEAAADWFRKATEINPHSRDYLYNYVQARYAMASDLEARIQENAEAEATVKPQLLEIYASLPADIRKVQEFDPTSEQLAAILARAQRRHGELSGDSAAGQQAALATLEAMAAAPVEVVELGIAPDDTGATATVTGKVRNKNLAAGAPVNLEITLLGSEGQTIGQMSFSVNAGEKDALVEFQQSSEIAGQIAGWRYRVTT